MARDRGDRRPPGAPPGRERAAAALASRRAAPAVLARCRNRADLVRGMRIANIKHFAALPAPTIARECELVPVFGGGLLPATPALVTQKDRISDSNPSATGLLHKGIFSSGERDNRFRARIDRTRP